MKRASSTPSRLLEYCHDKDETMKKSFSFSNAQDHDHDVSYSRPPKQNTDVKKLIVTNCTEDKKTKLSVAAE